MKRMRLGIVSARDGSAWGGSEELWFAAAIDAIARGTPVCVCLLRKRADHPKLDALRAKGVPVLKRAAAVEDLAERLSSVSWRLANITRGMRSPLRKLAAFRPDVLLINQGGSNPSLEIMDGVRAGFAAVPYVVVCHNSGRVTAAQVRELERRYFRDAYKVLFVAEDTLRLAERQLAVRLPNATVVRNPVSMENTDAMPWPDERCLRMACPGRLYVDAKGQDVLLEALSGPAWRSRNWRLSLYGEGPHRGYLEELVRHYQLGDRVDLPGHTDDIRSIWATHHVLLLPSRIESAPLVLVEAMLCGRPAVAVVVGGVREWVREGESAFLAEACTTSSFGAALDRAWSRRDEWSRMGESARSDALRLYDRAPGTTLVAILEEAAQRRPVECANG